MVEVPFAAELSVSKVYKPRIDRKDLPSNDIIVFYYFKRHARYEGNRLVKTGGEPLTNDMIRELCRIQLKKDGNAGMPHVIATFGFDDLPITKAVREVVEKTPDRLDILFELVSPLVEGYLARMESAEEDQEKKLQLILKELPIVGGKAVTGRQLLDMYAACRMYDFGYKELDDAGWRRLIGILTDRPVRAIPQLIKKFRSEPVDTDDSVIKEVRRVALLRKDDLLRGIDAACRECQGLKDPPTGFPRSLPREQQPPRTPIPPSHANAGSSFGPADKRPVARPQSTTSHAQHQSFAPGSRSAPYGYTLQPGYRNYGSAYGPPDMRPVTGGVSDTSHSHFQNSNPGYSQNLSPDQFSANVPAQFQHTGRYEHEAPIDREDSASSKDEPSTSSSGRSASPTQAETKRQEHDDKVRRSTAKGHSTKKVDEGAKRKSGDSRQKEADKAKDRAKQGRQNRP